MIATNFLRAASIFTIAMAFGIGSAQAQLFPRLGGQRAGISALTSLKLDVSPRAEAMGGTGISMNGDPYAMNVNPALMCDNESSTFALSHKTMASGISNSYMSGIIEGKHNNYYGLGLTYLNSGDIEKRTVFQPLGTGQFVNSSTMALGFSFGKVLSDYFSLGVSAKYVREQIAEFSANTVAVDLGFLYKTDYKDLRFAVMLQSFGPNSDLSGTFPTAVYQPTNPNVDATAMSGVFKLGLSMVPYKTELNQLNCEVQLNHPNDNAENISLGAEYVYMKMFKIRAGYRINVRDFDFPTAGVGVLTHLGGRPLNIDYAIIVTPYLGTMHQIGFGVSLNPKEKTDAPAAQ